MDSSTKSTAPSEYISPASGYMYAYHIPSDSHTVMYGKFGKSRFELLFDSIMSDTSGRTKSRTMKFNADFAPLLGIDAVNKIGKSPVSFKAGIGGKKFFVNLVPDPTNPGNAIFQTSNGLRGTVIRTHSSTWEVVAIVAILAAAWVAFSAMYYGADADLEVVLDVEGKTVTIDGSVSGSDRSENDDDDDSDDEEEEED